MPHVDSSPHAQVPTPSGGIDRSVPAIGIRSLAWGTSGSATGWEGTAGARLPSPGWPTTTAPGWRGMPRVVWHGFTQMSAYADNAPIVVDAAEGRELIDVEGRRYLDAISSLWVTTLGHRVPELDDAVRDQLDKVAHSTLLGNGNQVVIELAEALAERVPVDEPHFLFASDGAAAVEQALKIAFQYWTNQGVEGRDRYLAFTGAYHGDTIGSLSVGDGGFGTDVFDPLRFPVVRAPYGDLAATEAILAAEAHRLAAVVVEPLVQGAAGMALSTPEFVAGLADACRRHGVLLICDEVATGFGRTGTLFAVEQCGVRPDLLVLGKGITGGLPAAVGDGGQRARVRRVPRARPVGAHAVPRALLQRERPRRRRRAPPPRPDRGVGRARQRGRPGRAAGDGAGRRGRAVAGRGRGAPAGPDGRHRAGAAGRRAALGPPGVGRAAWSAACSSARWAT